MADNKVNKLLNSSSKLTTNPLLSSSSINTKLLTSSLLTSTSLKSSLLERKTSLDDRKKKTEEKNELLESKRPKLDTKASSFSSTKTSFDNLLTKNLSTTSSLLKSQGLSNSFLTSHSTSFSKTAFSLKSNALIEKKENLENYSIKDQSTIKSGLNIVLKEETSLTNASESQNRHSIRQVFEDLTNSQAYLDLIQKINEQNAQFDKDTKNFEEKNVQFLGYPSQRLMIRGDIEIVNLKNALINLVSSSLLKAPNFKNPKDQTRMNILEVANRIIPSDGEFILKLALYTRKELNIRVTANFLLSLASLQENCRKYLYRYFSASIVLPSDWIDVAEQYQSYGDARLKFGAIPSALRKVMVEKFSAFDEYQLAKYNKDKSKSKKSGKMKNIKHVKAHLKLDEKGNKIDETLINDDSPYEDKYMMNFQNGIKISDCIKAVILVKENCKTLKLDLVAKSFNDEQNNAPKRLVGRRGKPIPVANKPEKTEESVPLRFTIDYAFNRVTKKTFLKKSWSKPDVKMNSVEPVLNINNSNAVLNLSINTTASEFCIFVNDTLMMKHQHAKHGIELSKINCIRVSGVDIRLNDLVIESSDKINHDEHEDEEEIAKKTFTLKQLIRQLHISKPIQHVFGLLGKRYPQTYDEYLASGLPGIFESEKAGKRMRLAVPETWETQISMKGNKASVWEQLIDNKKLPYMAMLRNLRNMIKAGIDEKHHQWVLKKLQEEGAVVNSKQFPISFFSAYDVMDELEKEFQEYLTWSGEADQNERSSRKNKKAKNNEKKFKDMAYDEDILKRYKKALDNALKVATTYNISPIKGRTIIFLDTNSSMGIECKTARIGKSKRTVTEIASLLGLMFKYTCEDSRLLIYKQVASSACTEMQLQTGTILDNMKTIKELEGTLHASSKSGLTMETVLHDLISQRVLVDNLIILSQGLTDNQELVQCMNQFLSKYRVCVNEKLLFVNVDLGAQDTRLMLSNKTFSHENDVTINGYSDSILRFVAERGNQGQLLHVENIDKSYELPAYKHDIKNESQMEVDSKLSIEKPLELINTIPNWTTAKVFISSTFRDMHSERDILSRVVFPLLKSKLNDRFINVQEVDLRWGITENEASENKTLDICLKQVLECEFFIGMLGERYGYVPDSYQVKRTPELNWVCNYPLGASITELEIQCASFEKNDRRLEKTFFYFRDKSFMEQVPETLKFHFESEDSSAEQKLNNLKKRIVSNCFEVHNGYKCDWLGLDQQGRALVTNLEEFAQRVFDNLLNAIKNEYPHENRSQLDEYSHTTGLHESYISTCSQKFVGRQKLIKSCENLLKDQMKQFNFKSNNPHILLVEGDTGVGKTSFICKFVSILRELTVHVYPHIVGSCSGSEYTIAFLKRFSVEVLRNYNLKISQDIAKNSNDLKVLKKLFADILNELNTIVNDKFIIIIDGVDLMLDSNGNLDESLSWLPEKIPANITIVLSARKTSRIPEVLSKRVLTFSKKENVENKFHYDKFLIAELEILEKGEIIREHLNAYNKRLNENGFNNQMKFLTGKKDATNPLYLAIACEELRFHSHFETLTDKLKEIPPKIVALIPYVMTRLETDYGASYVTSAFLFLLNSKDGLKDYELKELINLYLYFEQEMIMSAFEKADSILAIKNLTSLSKLDNAISKSTSDAKFLSFIESISETFLKPFANNESSCLVIRYHPVIENCLRLKFTKSSLVTENTNKLMALYFWIKLDKKLDFNWSTKNTRAYTYLPYHLSFGSCSFDLMQILCDLKFLAGKSMLGLSSQLLQDYEFHNVAKAINIVSKANQSNKNSNQLKFNEFKKFFSENYHIIKMSPPLLFQQAMNQPPNSAPTENLRRIFCDKRIAFMFEETNKELQASDLLAKVLPLTIKDFNSTISSVAISANGQYLACGTEDCEIKLFLLSTAALIKKFQGHSGKINDLCFVGSDILCSTSSDGLASLWNISAGYRIKILNKHNGHCVSACSAEPKGKFLVTVGWDCSVKIWNTVDGSFSGEMKGHGRPINCVAYHPEGDIIATGCWDGCVRIFNVFNRERKAVFRGQSGSIRSISYSKNGVHISAASINGDVNLWSALTGAQVGTYKGHSLPVNCLRYSSTSEILATGSSDRKVKLWPSTPGKCIKVIQDKMPVTSVCIDQKMGKLIAVGYHTGEVKVYDLNTFAPLECKPHKAHVKRIKFNSSSNFVISGAEDGTLKIISLISTKKADVVADLVGHTSSINTITVNKVDTIITGCEDSLIRIYEPDFDDLKNFNEDCQKIKPLRTLNQHTSAVTACSFNSDGDKFVSASKDATLIIWKIENFYSREATELLRINSAHPDWITDCHWSSSSDFILTSSIDFTMKVFSSETGAHKNTMTGHTASISTCAFKYGCAISTCTDGSAKVWSHKGHEITTLLGHQSRVNGCDLFVKVIDQDNSKSGNSADAAEDVEMRDWADSVNDEERRKIIESSKLTKSTHKVDQVVVATVSDDCTIRIWKPLESDDLLCLQGHNERVESLVLGANNIMATASSDRSIKVWNLNNFMTNYNQGKINHSEKKSSFGHNSEITNICCNIAHSLVFTTSRDGMLIVWSCDNSNNKLNSLSYLTKYELHTAACNTMCIVSETGDIIEFATGSEDKTIKIWTYNTADQSISLKRTFHEARPVIYLSTTNIKEKDKKKQILISLESVSNQMFVSVFDINDKYSKPKSGCGCLINGYASFIYEAKIINSDLYITLINDGILKVNLQEIVSSFKRYQTYDNKLKKIVNREVEKDDKWYTCIAETDDKASFIAGDCKGNLHKVIIDPADIQIIKKIHDSHVTAISILKCGTDSRLITASQDGSVKIWTSNADKQLGQYNFSCGITCIKSVSQENNQITIVCADQSCDIHVLIWYDKNL